MECRAPLATLCWLLLLPPSRHQGQALRQFLQPRGSRTLLLCTSAMTQDKSPSPS
uniref:Sex hormone binding globulin n=1 Tax=Rousettus aegyptiacus TaxID=9407 RepID=A0A7J8GFQ9_ROUAE|nr:sex hormone binding globulin [Rousettus aegyptiacus]